MHTEYTITQFSTHAQGLTGWLATHRGLSVGHIFMQEEPNNRIKFLDAWVHPDHRREGIFRSLWEERWEYVLDKHPGHTAYAWCLPSSLPMLLDNGFTQGDVCVYVEREITADLSFYGPTVPITC